MLNPSETPLRENLVSSEPEPGDNRQAKETRQNEKGVQFVPGACRERSVIVPWANSALLLGSSKRHNQLHPTTTRKQT